MNGSADGNTPRRYPPFDSMGEGGLIYRQKSRQVAERLRSAASGTTRWVTRLAEGETVEAPQPTGWPFRRWETPFAPARPSLRAILEWLIEWESDAEREGLLDIRAAELRNRPPAEHLKLVTGNCKDFTSDLQLLVDAYGDDCPTLGGIDLPVDEFVSVDAARRVLRRVRARLSHEIASAETVSVGELTTVPAQVVGGEGQREAEKSKTGPTPRLAVDILRMTLALDGTVTVVASEQALRWVAVLAKYPGQWFSARELENTDPELVKPRTDRLKNELPKSVQLLIESQPGRGSRLRLA